MRSQMSLFRIRPFVLAGALLLLAVAAHRFTSSTPFRPLAKRSMPAQAVAKRSFGDLPFAFEANRGQLDPRARFAARSGKASVLLTSDGSVISLQSGSGVHASFEMRWLGSGHPDAKGVDVLPGKIHYFLGNNPSDWHTDIPTFQKVLYADLYPKIDLVYYGG